MASRPPRSKRLQPIERIAEQREEAAAQAIANARQRIASEQEKLEELRSFAEEYAQRLAPGAGLHTARELINWHQFFARLELAIRQQEQLVIDLQQQLEKLLQQWRALHLKRQSLQKVIAKSRMEEEVDRDKRLQRELDDRSAQRSRHD